MDWWIGCLAVVWLCAAANLIYGAIRHRRSSIANGWRVGSLWFHAMARYRESRDKRSLSRSGASSAPRHLAGDAVAPPPPPLARAPISHAPFDARSMRIRFLYVKADGAGRLRTVDLQGHGVEGGRRFIEGLCADAGETRSFRVDRIRGKVTDLSTGEMFSPSQLLRRLGTTQKVLDVNRFVTGNRGSGSKGAPGWRTAVFFAGFSEKRCDELSAMAEAAGMDVRGSISRTVDYVVAGSLAGQQQRVRAEAYAIPVIDEGTFRAMLELHA